MQQLLSGRGQMYLTMAALLRLMLLLQQRWPLRLLIRQQGRAVQRSQMVAAAPPAAVAYLATK